MENRRTLQMLQSLARLFRHGDSRAYSPPLVPALEKVSASGKLSGDARQQNNRAGKSKTMQMCRSVYFQTTNFRHSPRNVSAHKSHESLSTRRGRVCTDVLGAVGGGGLRLPVLSQESDEEERNGNISHTRINILRCFPWKSGSCGRMLDNVTGMRAASPSTDGKGRSGYRWDRFIWTDGSERANRSRPRYVLAAVREHIINTSENSRRLQIKLSRKEILQSTSRCKCLNRCKRARRGRRLVLR